MLPGFFCFARNLFVFFYLFIYFFAKNVGLVNVNVSVAIHLQYPTGKEEVFFFFSFIYFVLVTYKASLSGSHCWWYVCMLLCTWALSSFLRIAQRLAFQFLQKPLCYKG